MRALNLEEMANFSSGLEAGPGISCTLNARIEIGDERISYWSCDNGTSMTNFSHRNAFGE